MAVFPATGDEINNLLHKIKPNSNLNDILPVNYLKSCADIIIEPLAVGINKCFAEGNFPNELKCARIVPIFINGDSLDMENYRPISLLSDFSKICEQAIFERMQNFCVKYNLINKNQFGFQRQSGTLSAAICLIDNIRPHLDKSNQTIAACLFIDVSKAFDTIPRDLLLNKLYRYGFRGKSHELISSYLGNRTQKVSISHSISNTLDNNFGTPQGSTLGPLLFLLFINDIIHLKLHGKIVLFADDAALSYGSTDLAELNRMMSEDIATLSEWFQSNKLTLNLKKSKCMVIHPKQESKKVSINLTINGERIEQGNSFVYLGLTIQENLHWNMHIAKICTKVGRMAGVMSRLNNNVNEQFLTSIYYSHVHSHISYLPTIWGHSATDYQISSLQMAQNNAIRSIFRILCDWPLY